MDYITHMIKQENSTSLSNSQYYKLPTQIKQGKERSCTHPHDSFHGSSVDN